jgi:hypothetical protein
VQQRGEPRRGNQREHGDGGTETDPQPYRTALLGAADATDRAGARGGGIGAGRHVQRDPGLDADRRHDPDDEDRHQRADLAEGRRDEEPRGGDREDVARRVTGDERGGDQQRLAAQAGGPGGRRHRHPTHLHYPSVTP